ncbi:bifunctional methylenetetrahydrofolate dehydrogenase/methenyltetrahydrofolate cyclohydrolase FolD [Variovorax sp. VNK109]|jgi:methylenetetrahydrofolate dehydrogenase (NADP+)/methenyltetrahydrofolate cyclohydrolase|uniref:bifunctional methylenetetrahydrofolate dehydrogenase/methenyltetrahydrofolate cyclohydrolase FolD n=1 Tax=Variovorax sp. VNK109 TaxID=3400919 RepID=UPI003BFE145E
MAKIIDGRALARRLREDYRVRVAQLVDSGTKPGLAVVLVGESAASIVYVNNKIKACREVGIESHLVRLPSSVSQKELIEQIDALNNDDAVHGILVQLPLPPHIDIGPVLQKISRDKDVDGFHLYNVGALAAGHPAFAPCTPQAVMAMLESEGIPIAGQNVVIVGASNIVGKPMALMMLQAGATISVCHALTKDLGQYTLLADILVVAAGHPNLIVPQMVKRGAVVIDVGINRLADGSITGDVDFAGVREKASHISPVPGGVGPMTVTMLISNTLMSATNAASLVVS